MPVSGTELLFQFVSILLIILGCWSIARVLFDDERVQWAGVALTAAMMTLPVAGTALYLADQHLHPRNVATALVLLAVSRILVGKRWQAVPLLLLSFVLHPIMATLGISFCFFLSMAMLEPVHVWLRSLRDSLAAAVPLGWIFESPTPIWHRALQTRSYYFLYSWTWYEWLGALGPLFLFWLLWRVALKRGETMLARFALAILSYGVFQQARGHDRSEVTGAGAAHAHAADALSASHLFLPHARGRMSARQVSAEDQYLALGSLSGRHQRRHVRLAARPFQQQRAPGNAWMTVAQSVAAVVRLDSREHPDKRLFCHGPKLSSGTRRGLSQLSRAG